MKSHAPLAILLLGFTYLYIATLGSHGGFMWDEAEYANLGRDIATGETYGSNFRPPMVPLAVASALKISEQADDATIKVPIALFGVLTLAVVYFILNKNFDPGVGIASAGFLALAPGYWVHTSFLLSEIPFILFFTGAVLCFCQGLYGESKWFYASWAFTGLAFLTRYTCVLLGPIFVLFVILGVVLDKPTILEKLKSKDFWLSPLVGLLVQLPWLIRQALAYGDPLVGFRYAAGQLQAYAPEVSMPANFYLVSLPAMITIPVFVLCVVGIAWAIMTRDKFGLHCLLVAVFLLVWFSAYRYKELRLITAILPFLTILAGLGYGKVLTRLWAGFSVPWVALVLVSGLTFYANQTVAPFFKNNSAVGYPGLKEASIELSKYLKDGDVLMAAPSPQFAWYTNKKVVGFPPPEELAKQLESVNYVIIVTYERGQPDYIRQLVVELFPEDANKSKKYMILSDKAKNLTFVTSAEEFRGRLLNSKKK